MLDSSKYQESQESKEFDSYEHFMELCNQYNLRFEGTTVYYPLGWRALMIGFMNQVQNQLVIITEVEASYGLLEVRFEMQSDQNEVEVWRIVNTLRLRSRQTCMECGKLTSMINVPQARKRVCRDCLKKDSGYTDKGTGTWLDKY